MFRRRHGSNFFDLILRALVNTETELKAMANPEKIGLSNPKAAIGIQ